MKPLRTMMSLLIIMSLTGCYNISYRHFDERPAEASPQQTTAHIFFYGLVNTGAIDIKTYCPTGVARLQSELTPADWLFHIFTGGLYTPRTIKLWCSRVSD